MNKKVFLFLIMSALIVPLFSDEIPRPKNEQLYTDFVSYRIDVDQKRSVMSSGYIVMDGVRKFLYKQVIPVMIDFRRNGDKMTFKKENMERIDIDEISNGIIIIFDYPDKIKEEFDIKKSFVNDKEQFNAVPKEIEDVDSIKIIASGDKIIKIVVQYTDGSFLVHEFMNMVTGVRPDDIYF
jgi:hypothetical protein